MAYLGRRVVMRKTRIAAKLQAMNNFAEMDTQMKLEALAAEYRAARFSGRITLSYGRDNEKGIGMAPDRHWRPVAAEIEVHEVPGDHMGMIRQPHVENTARLLRSCIQRADALEENPRLPQAAPETPFPQGSESDRWIPPLTGPPGPAL